MKTLIFFALTMASAASFAEQRMTCDLIDGNVSGLAQVTVDHQVGGEFIIRDDGLASFRIGSSDKHSFTPEVGPYNSMGLMLLPSKTNLSKNGRYLSIKEHLIHCGRSDSTHCNTTATLDRKTNQLRVSSKIGIIFVYTEIDYLMQCR